MISVITINYNNDSGLERTLNSIMCQKDIDFEYIVIDGNSNDKSLKLLKNYSKKNFKYVSSPDQGIYDAFNKGVNLAKGDFIIFINSGDIFANSYVTKLLNDALIQNKDFSGIYGNKKYASFIKKAKYSKRDIKIKRVWNPGNHNKLKYFWGWMIPHQALIVKSSLFSKYGNFDTSFRISGDYDWLLRVFFVGDEKVKYINEDIVIMESGGISNSNWLNVTESNKEVLRSWHKNYWFVPLWIFITKPLSKIFQLSNFKV